MVTIFSGMLEPGVPTAIFTKFTAKGVASNYIALAGLADGIKRQAKINASTGKHAYGTKTPAYPGTGPAMISRTLKQSIQRSTPERKTYGWLCRVGTEGGRMPPYRAGPHTSSQYGYILEVTGCRDGSTYPFLYPAAKFGFDYLAEIIYKEAYGNAWLRLF